MNSLRASVTAERLTLGAFLQPRQSPIRALRRLLEKLWETEFGRAHGLRPNLSLSDFRSAIPIRTYADYDPWLRKIREGQADVLWPGRPLYFASTSGTTAENKTVPITQDFISDYHLGTVASLHRMLFHTPKAVTGKVLTLGGPSREGAIGDIPIGSITGILFENFPKTISKRLVVPPDVHNISNEQERLYVIARHAIGTSVSGAITMVPTALLTLHKIMNEAAGDLIREVRDGSMKRLWSCPLGLEQTLRAQLVPDPKRAEFLEKTFNETGGIHPRDIWPFRGICAYTKLGLPSQWLRIRQYYGETTVIDPGLVATEGRVSVGLTPNATYHAVIPVSSFVELLPLSTGSSFTRFGNAILPHQAEVGGLYCPVISSSNGLIRYRLGDVVRVCGRVHHTPLIEYVGRLDNSLSVAGEKMCEAHFRDAIEILRDKGFLIEGSWAVSTEVCDDTASYSFTWETDEPTPTLGRALDNVLQDVNVSYRRKRTQGLLLPINVSAVPLGQMPVDKMHWVGQSKTRHLHLSNRDPVSLMK